MSHKKAITLKRIILKRAKQLSLHQEVIVHLAYRRFDKLIHPSCYQSELKTLFL